VSQQSSTPQPSSPQELPLWRSALFVPANVEKFVAKAHTRGADAIILDLEDSVILSEKDNARDLLKSTLAAGGYGSRLRIVRIIECICFAWWAATPAPIMDSPSLPGCTAGCCWIFWSCRIAWSQRKRQELRILARG